MDQLRRLREVERARSNTMRHSVNSLFALIQEQDQSVGDKLAENQSLLSEMKKNIAVASKENFSLERNIRNLDQKIALLIRNRISLEEVMASSGDISLVNRTVQLKNQREKELYAQLFYLLMFDPKYIATLARLVKLGEIDNLLQTVMFTLYGNQYDDQEEHLLLSMFQLVLQEEFKQASGIGSLLRANTAITRMMTTYTRRGPGQQCLKAVLDAPLRAIVGDKDTVLEVNPLKVYEAMINDDEIRTGKLSELKRKVPAEEAAANPRVKEIIAPRMKKLGEITDKFVQSFVDSIEKVPYGVRWICRQIKELVHEKFPDATQAQTCALIAGFFILRFINPAIVTPQAFMLIDMKLNAAQRRNLTLIAKILQNLSNNIRFGGMKEFFMDPLNAVLDRNRERFNKFLLDLTRVEELEERLNMDKYLTMGRTEDIVINISLNEMYFVHARLNQHLGTLTEIEGSDGLRQIMEKLGEAPEKLPRTENANVDLKLDSQSMVPPHDPADNNVDTLYQETKYLMFTIIKALPKIATPSSNIADMLEAASRFADETNNIKLANMVTKIRQDIEKLCTAGLLRKEDNYAQLRRDAVRELTDYEAKIVKTQEDLMRLDDVLLTVKKHHGFLQDQLDAYIMYLDNVREQVCATNTSKKKKEKRDKKQEKKDKKAAKQLIQGPFKFSHTQLESDGVIVESEVPKDRRSNIFFSFRSPKAGLYTVEVMYKSRHLAEFPLQLDELLDLQHQGEQAYETDFLTLNINLLIHLLNKHFVAI